MPLNFPVQTSVPPLSGVFQLTLHAAVDRVGEIGAESLHIEEIHAPAHLLVGGEADADFSVFLRDG